MPAPSVVTPVDILAIGPHPDDIEIGIAGTLANHAQRGRTVGLCDLTKGELGTNGTSEERLSEAEVARKVLGAVWRVNLALPDGGLSGDETQVRALVDLIRACRPRTLAAPYWEDRHPDHRAASSLASLAAFRSGLRRFDTGVSAWKPEWVCYYFINDWAPPSFVIDVSDTYDIKRRALDCHLSQFGASSPGAAETRLTSPLFRQLIESRDAQFGASCGVQFAEGFVVRELIVRGDLLRRAELESAGVRTP